MDHAFSMYCKQIFPKNFLPLTAHTRTLYVLTYLLYTFA